MTLETAKKLCEKFPEKFKLSPHNNGMWWMIWCNKFDEGVWRLLHMLTQDDLDRLAEALGWEWWVVLKDGHWVAVMHRRGESTEYWCDDFSISKLAAAHTAIDAIVREVLK